MIFICAPSLIGADPDQASHHSEASVLTCQSLHPSASWVGMAEKQISVTCGRISGEVFPMLVIPAPMGSAQHCGAVVIYSVPTAL